MNKKERTGILAALMLVGIIAVSGAVSAFGGDCAEGAGRGQGKGFGAGNGFLADEHDTIIAAVEADDYDAWKNAIISSLTEENFEEFVQRHNDRYARQLVMQEHRDEITAAIESGDYGSWKDAMAKVNTQMELDESVFQNMVAIHNARSEGDFETAKELRGELGVPRGIGPSGIKGHLGNAMKFFRDRIAD